MGEKGIPLNVNPYSAVPLVTVTPSGIWHDNEMVKSWPLTTGSGVIVAVRNLKTDVPDEQSRIVFTPDVTATKAPRNLSIFYMTS